jgi:glucokinase
LHILDDFLRVNLVHPVDDRQEMQGGKPSELFEFSGEKHAVIGLDLGGTKLLGALINLRGHNLKEIRRDSCPGDPQKNIDLVVLIVEELIASSQSFGVRIIGIGVGAPGITNSQEGQVVWAPGLGWRNLPLASILSGIFHLPVRLENDVNLATIGEAEYGVGRGAKNLVCISIGTGIGSGILIGGALYHGSHNTAGEIGYLPPGVTYLNRHYEQFGALESLASGRGIAERARQILLEEGHDLSAFTPDAEEVFAAARRGESWALKVVDETVDHLALGVAAYACLLDPDVIILTGGVSQASDLLIDRILDRIDGVVPYKPKLLVSPLGNRAALLGAVPLLLNHNKASSLELAD